MQAQKVDYLKHFKSLAEVIQVRAAIIIIATNVVCAAPAVAQHAAGAAAQTTVSGTVTRVVDGDTIWVQTSSRSKPLKVRIQAIDAPEICQSGGIAARDALKFRVFGNRVTLVTSTTDSYRRTVARVDLQGADIGRWLVGRGHAWSLGQFQSAGPYAADQLQAQIARRGVFGGGTPERPTEFRKRHGSCLSGQ